MDWVFWRKIKDLYFYLYILIGAIVLQGIYYLYFYQRIMFYNSPKTLANKESPSVSVLVCAHNELKNLKLLIPALLQQSYSSFEVIVAIDRSKDGSYEFLSTQFGKETLLRLVKIDTIQEGVNGKKNALTKAIELSNYEVLLLTDADCLPLSTNWIANMVAELGPDKDIVLGYSPYREQFGIVNCLIRFETLYTAIQYFSFALAKLPYMGVGRNLMYRKQVFIRNNGFTSHSDVTGGDDDLFIREVGNKHNVGICLHREGQMESMPKESYWEWIKQKRRHLSVGVKYKPHHKLLIGVQQLSQLIVVGSVFGVLFTNNSVAIVFLILRGLVFVVIFALIARKLGDNYKWWWLLIPIELVYTFSYLMISLSLVFYKKIKWS